MKVTVIRTKFDISTAEQLQAVFYHVSAIRRALGFVVPEGSPIDRFGGCRELCRAGGENGADVRLLERNDGGGYVVADFGFDQLGKAEKIGAAWSLFAYFLRVLGMVKEDVA